MKQNATKQTTIIVPLLIVMCLMFFWNMSRNINDILIPHLKRACQLTDLQSSLVQSAFFGAYFILALPAGFFIQKRGYKAGMIVGLLIAAIGAALFYPAAQIRYYPLFLLALFIMAAGFTFLEVTATPYISKLGDANAASSRLSLSAAVGSVGATIAPYIGSLLLLHEEDIPQTTIDVFNPNQLHMFLTSEANLVKIPYLGLAILFIIMAAVLLFIKIPAINEEKQLHYSFKNTFRFPQTMLGILAVFCYVGAEVGIVSFLIRYSKSMHLVGLTEQKSALFITVFMALVLLGRLLGTFVLKKFIPSKILVISALGAFTLVLIAIITNGYLSLWSLAIVGLFTSVIYPIVFTLSIKGLGEYTKTASSLLIMGIIGGAIIPPIMGLISDNVGIKFAFFAPLVCYAYILYYGFKSSANKI